MFNLLIYCLFNLNLKQKKNEMKNKYKMKCYTYLFSYFNNFFKHSFPVYLLKNLLKFRYIVTVFNIHAIHH